MSAHARFGSQQGSSEVRGPRAGTAWGLHAAPRLPARERAARGGAEQLPASALLARGGARAERQREAARGLLGAPTQRHVASCADRFDSSLLRRAYVSAPLSPVAAKRVRDRDTAARESVSGACGRDAAEACALQTAFPLDARAVLSSPRRQLSNALLILCRRQREGGNDTFSWTALSQMYERPTAGGN